MIEVGRELVLGEITSVITKGTTPTTLGYAFTDEGVGFIKVESISEGGTIIPEKLSHIDDKTHDVLRRSKLHEGDILFSIAGAIGRTALVDGSILPANTNQAIAIVRVDDSLAVPKYVYYYLRSATFLNYSLGRVVQTAQANVSLGELRKAPIRLPARAVQQKIAGILSSYDELIENNVRRMEILEESARSLYQEWFVHFRFPGHASVPLVESDMRPIPEGWEIKTLRGVLARLESGSRPRGGVDPNERGVPSIGAENITGLGKYDYAKEKYVSQGFYSRMRRGHVVSGDVLLYKDGAHIGRKTLFRDGFPHARCCINEHVLILRANEPVTQSYLFFWLDQPDMTQTIRNLNSNAAQPGINQEGVKNLPILIPDPTILRSFERLVDPILAQLFNLAKQTRILGHTRELLLPKLISGEIDGSRIEVGSLHDGS